MVEHETEKPDKAPEFTEFLNAKHYINLQYGPSRLHLLNAYVPKRQPKDLSKAVWLIYIHGGAWRDPMIDRTSFEPALNVLLGVNPPFNIAGFISLDYRLSAYPSHPTNPSSPDDPIRNIHHPEHTLDVLKALSWLNRTKIEYTSGDGRIVTFPDTDLIRQGRYVLCGHSCGAAIALHASRLMTDSGNLSPPLATMGLEGIYDIPGLVARHTHTAYREFITAAFGEKEEAWLEQSAISWHYTNWQGNVLLIHSDEDELVEMEQMETMASTFVKQGWSETVAPGSSGDKKSVRQRVIHCLHDVVWMDGLELAKAIRWVSELVS